MQFISGVMARRIAACDRSTSRKISRSWGFFH